MVFQKSLALKTWPPSIIAHYVYALHDFLSSLNFGQVIYNLTSSLIKSFEGLVLNTSNAKGRKMANSCRHLHLDSMNMHNYCQNACP